VFSPKADIPVLPQLSKYPVLNNLERQTNVPKVYAILGLVGVYFFLVFFNIAGEFLVNFAGFLIPGYYSLQALFTSNTQDDTQVRNFALAYFHSSMCNLLTLNSHSGSP
jgi:receptor expression-enhancing protein 5/6